MEKLNSFADLADRYDLYQNLKDTGILEVINKQSSFNSPYNWGGLAVPRVTEIINSMIHNDSLMRWSNSLGFKHTAYDQYMESVANIGTITHDMISCFLNNMPIRRYNVPPESLCAFNSFTNWWTVLNDEYEVEILAQEYPLICPYYGGTLDLFITLNGHPVLVDFKTSNRITYKHFIQLAAYVNIISESSQTTFGDEEINGYILQLDKYDISYKPYVATPDVLNNYRRLFDSLLQAWYFRKLAELEFNTYIQTK